MGLVVIVIISLSVLLIKFYREFSKQHFNLFARCEFMEYRLFFLLGNRVLRA